MKKFYFAVCKIAFLSAVIFFSSPAYTAPRIDRNNVRTAYHEHVAGTRVAIVPPSGAVPRSGMRGYVLKDGSGRIDVFERALALDRALEDLKARELAANGCEIVDTTDVVINGQRSIMIDARAEDGSAAAALLVEVGGRTSVIFSRCAASDLSSVKRALLSAVVDESQSGSKNDAGRSGFSVSTSGTDLSVVAVENFTERYAAKGTGEATLTISAVDIDADAVFDDHAAAEFESFTRGRDLTNASVRKMSIAGMSAIETTAFYTSRVRRDRTASGGTIRRSINGACYQLIIFGGGLMPGRAFVFHGFSTDEADRYIAQFQRIASTFTIKR